MAHHRISAMTDHPRRSDPVRCAPRRRSIGGRRAGPLIIKQGVMADSAVHVEGVVKRFGTTQALAGVDLDVEEATVFGLLGPNGAGKTTLVRVLATLLTPDAGRAEVFGRDVVHDAAGVRELLGLTGQFAAVDEMLTGRENLQMFGRLFDLSAAEARRRGNELLDRFD